MSNFTNGEYDCSTIETSSVRASWWRWTEVARTTRGVSMRYWKPAELVRLMSNGLL